MLHSLSVCLDLERFLLQNRELALELVDLPTESLVGHLVELKGLLLVFGEQDKFLVRALKTRDWPLPSG